jgi:hypothetical protein
MSSSDANNESLASGNRPSLPVIMPFEAGAKESRRPWWRGVLAGEWQAHSRWLLGFISAWLATVWILPQFASPGWILVFGFVFALAAGPAFGGKDVLEGCEEYTFALALTRSEWFLARWLVGAGLVVVFTAMDLLMLGLDLSQAMTRFYLDMGLLDTKGALQHRFLYSLILVFPLTCYSLSFSLAVNARGRGAVLSSWMWGGLGALAVLRLGLLYEFWQWNAWTGYFACPFLILAAFASVALGLRVYGFKEVVNSSKPWNMPAYWWAWVLLFLGALGTITFLVSSLGKELASMLGK